MTATAAQPLLEVEHLAVSFGALHVLEDVELTVPRGQAVGIVGPNGAGKSTLLSAISGVERATRGTVRIAGRDVTRTSAAQRCRLGVGRSFQIPRPFGDLTVFENALVGAQRGGRLRGAQAHEQALQALETTGMLALADKPAGALPLLGRKRLELARALATGPELLLLDEIAGGLTESEADELVSTVLSLKESGVTILWIEHVVKALVQVVDRLVCLAYGRIRVDGDPHEVLASPEVAEVYLGGAAA
ncbi:ABC transporter ATP-binding protein [Streptomyces acidiscabies]|uniref:ABC transporter ATP-binding protein n=1 Tax=Streptomyces acidiscabies TaxID=42234 RepID=UPI00076EAD66|nr:ABC transporter ATP-binding protein [Streptomyces acidiscabies]GAQ55284.1 lipopolysaccharide export system ATP-binding protein [Streptomyces acidiscabies]GAV40541.1 lipopolysaccharide export system ATP-binding protein [Streptomyces acidiscabies]